MHRDHGSSVNAYRAVSIEPARYNGHLRVSVWFFPQLEINRCPSQTCNTRKLEGKFLPPLITSCIRGESREITQEELLQAMLQIVSAVSFYFARRQVY